MVDLDKWQEILATLRANKLRTALTAFGVSWGVFMLLVMLGAGNGLQNGITSRMAGFATNSMYVWGQRTTMPYQGMQPGRRVEFDNGDVAAIARLPGIEHLAPRNGLGRFGGSNMVTRGTRAGSFSVMGDYPQFQYVQSMRFTGGRFLNDIDIRERRKVAVIGAQVQEQLFAPGEDPVGAAIAIGGVYFQVVGTFEPFQSGDDSDRQAQTVFIPFTTFQQAFNYGNRVGWFAITARPDVPVSELEQEVRAVLAARHKIHPGDEQAIGSYNAQEEFAKVQKLFLGIQGIIWFVGIMTLLAGVIGVINIMLITVKERTKEIGVRKALGATPRSIVTMILQEAVALTSLAGCVGILMGVGAIEWIASLGIESQAFAAPTVGFSATLAATLILVVSGALAGIIPAFHAASISPVEALRAE
jgi:putative ABC transport system permease protein